MDLHSTSGALALDQQLQQYVRTVATRDRDVERVGPFTATFDPHSTNRYLSYAFPDDAARPTPDDVAALIAAYRRRERIPRLEFLPAVAWSKAEISRINLKRSPSGSKTAPTAGRTILK